MAALMRDMTTAEGDERPTAGIEFTIPMDALRRMAMHRRMGRKKRWTELRR